MCACVCVCVCVLRGLTQAGVAGGRTDLYVSMVGAVVYTAAFLIWLIVYLEKWRSWGETGDGMTVYVPLGDPK